MSVKIMGSSGRIAEVDVDGNLNITLSKDVTEAGFVAMAAEISEVNGSVARLVRTLDVSPDYRARVGTDTLLWSDSFANNSMFNTSKYKGNESVMAKACASGRLAMNSGNSLAANANCNVQTFRTFPLHLSYALYIEHEILFTQNPVTGNVDEWGLGYATGVAAPTDGIIFRLNAAGVLQGVINNNGAETIVPLAYSIASNTGIHTLIVIHNDRTEFWIDDKLYGVIATPLATGSPSFSSSLPLLWRSYNTALTSTAQRMECFNVVVSLADMGSGRLWATAMAGMGQSSIHQPDGSASMGQSAGMANSAASANASLSNTTAGYTTLGGQFQHAAVVGSETDYALFAFQVPAASATNSGKNLVIRGIRIDTMVTGAAVATTSTALMWSLGVGATSVTLATIADVATTGVRAARRIPLGIQSFAVGAAIGAVANPVDVNLDAPVIVEPGTILHVILKIPVGTATASQIIRGTVMINGFYE